MIETASVALATFLATIGPLDIAAIYAALTATETPQYRRSMAFRGTLMATAILLTFALGGELILDTFGISLAALRTAGGILLLLIGIEMVFARSSGGTSTAEEETLEAAAKRDIAVFPLATPLIAGPGTIGATILLMANAQGNILQQILVLISLLTSLIITFVSLLMASRLQQFLGVTGMLVVSRVMGILLSALAIQFMFDGIEQSGLLRH